MNKRKIILAGGSGFLGKILAEHFFQDDIVVLSRSTTANSPARVVQWDGKHIGSWTKELEGAAVVINLSGRSVDCRYTARNKKLIMDSRVDSTRILGEAIAQCADAPKVWINLSTATIYKHSYDTAHEESTGEIGATHEAHDRFSIEVAQAWEKTFEGADTPDTRKIIVRLAMVFDGNSKGVYSVLRRLTKLGIGGKMGDGRQRVSWIHRDDFCRANDWLIGNTTCEGVYNISAPSPLRNETMMKELRTVFAMPFGLPANRWMLEIGALLMRTETELILKSRNVIPGRLMDEGFTFLYPRFSDAIAQLAQTNKNI